jgi:predicted dehydrogenase
MKKTLNIAMIGGGFMGKAHSSAWLQLNKFFDAPFKVNLKTIVGSKTRLESFAANWGYGDVSYDWQEVVNRKDIDIVDIGTPTYLHMEMAVAAARAGKHIVCEKPCAMNYSQCLQMAVAAETAGVTSYLNHNYRRVPAVAYARQLVQEGRLGRIFHWRGAYLQDWIIDPDFPLIWQLKEETAGAGTLFDLGSHAVDLSRFIIGEPAAITAVNKTFVKERPLPGESSAVFSKGEVKKETKRSPVTVDDAAFMVLEYENSALGSIDVSRFACGRKNYNDFEIYGEKGALKFNFERMNELEFLDFTQPAEEQGYRRILVTEGNHPYLSAWWPSGHIIGYEHTFTNAFYDFLCAIDKGQPVLPDFRDGSKTIRCLDAAKKSSLDKRRVKVEEITG